MRRSKSVGKRPNTNADAAARNESPYRDSNAERTNATRSSKPSQPTTKRRLKIVVGTKARCHEAGRILRRLTGDVGLDKASEKIAIVDGTPWIVGQLKAQSWPLDARVLDFYHLCENVHKARRAVFGEDSDEGRSWVAELLHTFKHSGYQPAHEKLVSWHKGLQGRKRKAAGSLLDYVEERKEMLEYGNFRDKGWDIGSGPREACCKTLTARLKRSGMALAALKQSGLWDSYWKNQLPQPA